MEQRSTQQTNNEIDLGQLFQLIAKGFRKIFNAFGAFKDWVKSLVLGVILFFVRNIKVIGLTTLIGFTIGAVIDYSTPPIYFGSMEVRPNMGSGRSLYKNIAYYNSLAEQQEYEKLAEVFKISLAEASSLRSFEIRPIVIESRVFTAYDNLLRSLDSLTAVNLDFERYQEEFLPYDHSRHLITVEGTNKAVFALLGDDMIKEITENEFYKKQQVAEFDVLDQDLAFLKESQKKVDALRKIYLEALMLEAKKETSQGTSINMGTQSERETKELELFSKESTINAGLAEIIRERVRNSEVVSVISEFEEIGAKVSGVERRKSVILGSIFCICVVLFVLIKDRSHLIKGQ